MRISPTRSPTSYRTADVDWRAACTADCCSSRTESATLSVSGYSCSSLAYSSCNRSFDYVGSSTYCSFLLNFILKNRIIF